MFVIWPKYAVCTISHDSETTNFFGHTIAHAILPALPGMFLS